MNANAPLVALLTQKTWIVPIPGTRKLTRLDENLASTNVELTAADLNKIDEAASQIEVHGARGTGHERHA